jgi:Fe-S cluster biogenesis protein NfuA
MSDCIMGNHKKKEFQLKAERIEELANKLAKVADPELHASAMELVQSVMELHAAAINRMMEVIDGQTQGERIIAEILNDPLVAGVLILHDLHPEDIETRVLRALEKVRPYLRSHGGDVELIGLEEGVARLRLHGSCGSCPSSSSTLKSAVEEAIHEAAPDVVHIVAENVTIPQSNNHSQLVVLK